MTEAAEAVAGVTLAAATAGLKASGNPDLAVIALADGTTTVAVFTRNAFRAAPVRVAETHLERAMPRLLVINSGCANAGTGVAGEADARATCEYAAATAGVNAAQVLPFSTGVIGQPLPVEPLCGAVSASVPRLSADGWAAAADAIRTTDTVAKTASTKVALEGGTVTVTGMAKGAGMIRPDMATMLAFVATDAVVEREPLAQLLHAGVDASFHCITVDGDTSTNDAVTLSASGASGVAIESDDDAAHLQAGVTAVCRALARAIVRDAEGGGHVIAITVSAARTVAEARDVAFTVAHSLLVKTAVHGGDPNWGRILAAVGRAPVDGLDIGGVDIALGDVALVTAGQPVSGLDEARAAAAIGADEVAVEIALGRGTAGATVWTSDLSCDYVRINADYRT